jgi:hypothetical protein
MLCKPMVAPRNSLSAACTVPAVKAAVEINRRVPQHDQRRRDNSRRGCAPSRQQRQDGGGAHRDSDDARPAPSLRGFIAGDRDGNPGEARYREEHRRVGKP